MRLLRGLLIAFVLGVPRCVRPLITVGRRLDKVTVLVDRQQIKVRLVEIDAPEKAQAFGNRSKQSLFDLCFNKTATLADKGKDRYGRTLARVYCDGVEANAEQVRRGMAWVYDRYAPRNSSLYGVQAEVKAATRGMCQDADAIPP